MKTKKEYEVYLCDICGGDSHEHYACRACGKNICYECQPKRAVGYSKRVYGGSDRDFIYCPACDAQDQSELHDALIQVKVLRFLCDAADAELKKRIAEVEAAVRVYDKNEGAE